MIDPITLLAAASAAVSAVRKGCEMYKEAKSVAGDAREVLEDLRRQFNSGSRSKEAKEQYEAEVKRVKETAAAEPNDMIANIGDHLGKFFDAYDAIEKVFYEEELNAKRIYTGDVSIGRRALQRVLIRTRLEAMQAEIREEMVYRTPPELKDLYTRFEKMRKQILDEQKAAQEIEFRNKQIHEAIKRRRINELKAKSLWIGAVMFVIAWFLGILILIRTSLTYRGF